jgi:hypothetical protein
LWIHPLRATLANLELLTTSISWLDKRFAMQFSGGDGDSGDNDSGGSSEATHTTWVIRGGKIKGFVPVAIRAAPQLVGSTVAAIQLAVSADPGLAPPPKADSSVWQTVAVQVDGWPNISAPPRYLHTAITDAPVLKLENLFVLDKGHSLLSAYRQLGMSILPTSSSNLIDPNAAQGAPNKYGHYYFPANRTGGEWKAGLRYGVEHGTFGRGFNGKGYFCLAPNTKTSARGIGCPVNASELPLGLSAAERAIELRKWANVRSIAYWCLFWALCSSFMI